jgi:hypothetical protein
MAAAFPCPGARRLYFNQFVLNLSGLIRDQVRALLRRKARRGGNIFMQTIRPDNADPIPLRNTPPRMGTIMIRFVGLLVLAVAVLALAWSR